jgi:hypothetical protein
MEYILATEEDELEVILEIFNENVHEELHLFDDYEVHSRNANYFECTIPMYNLDDFKKHFRM